MTEIESVITEKNVLSQKLCRELARAFPDNEIPDRRAFDVLFGEERDKSIQDMADVLQVNLHSSNMLLVVE